MVGGGLMEQSYKFRDIEVNLTQILEILLSNENFKKYIYYSTDNPLAEANVPSDVNLFEKHIILKPFSPKILDESRITMFFNYRKCSFNGKALSNIMFVADIVIPISKWTLPGIGFFRWVRIADEIAMGIDQQAVSGIGNAVVGEPLTFTVNDEFSGISLPITIHGTTLKGLR